MVNPFYTIGHGTRPLHEFTELLKGVAVTLVVDVRTVPRSRTNPQYNGDTLPGALSGFEIGYEHVAELGGRRGRQRNVPPATNAFWHNESFHNFADYATGEDFRAAIGRLRQLGHSARCAVMCAETLWWQCHRRIVADYLIAAGEAVFHIVGPGHVAPALLTPSARLGADGALTYSAEI